MSAILFRREVNIAITAEEAGKEFGDASSDVQVAFLMGWLQASEKWAWPIQCRHIADEVPDHRRVALLVLLKTLADHLGEIP